MGEIVLMAVLLGINSWWPAALVPVMVGIIVLNIGYLAAKLIR